MQNKLYDLWDYLNTNFNQISVLVLALTAIEAMRARRSSNETNDLSLLPLIVVNFGKGKQFSVGGETLVKNIGNGSAFDVEIDTLYWFTTNPDTKKTTTYKVIFNIPNKNIFSQDEEVKIRMDVFANGKKMRQEDIGDFIIFAMRHYKIRPQIFFKDIRGSKYVSTIEMNHEKRGAIILPPRKYGLIRKIIFIVRTTITYIQAYYFSFKR